MRDTGPPFSPQPEGGQGTTGDLRHCRLGQSLWTSTARTKPKRRGRRKRRRTRSKLWQRAPRPAWPWPLWLLCPFGAWTSSKSTVYSRHSVRLGGPAKDRASLRLLDAPVLDPRQLRRLQLVVQRLLRHRISLVMRRSWRIWIKRMSLRPRRPLPPVRMLVPLADTLAVHALMI